MSDEAAPAASSRVPAPDTPVAAGTERSWKPLGFLTVMRNVPVKMPLGLFILRVGQILAAGVVIGCLVWNLTYNDFSGVSIWSLRWWRARWTEVHTVS